MNPTEQKDLYKFGMVKDKRRRILLPIPNTDTAYHIPEREMKKVGLINGQTMWIMLVFVLSIGILNLPLVLCALVTGLTYLGFELYKRFVFYKDKAIIKLDEKDKEILNSEEALLSQRSDARIETVFGFTLILVIFMRFFEKGGVQGLDFVMVVLLLSVSSGYIARSIAKWLKVSKRLKHIKASK